MKNKNNNKKQIKNNTLWLCFMIMLEKDVVLPISPLFYKRYIDDIISRRKNNKPDKLLEKMMSYHKNINFTVEESPSKFLDT